MTTQFSITPALKYVTQSIVIQVFITLVSNFLIKRRKNFSQLVKKMDEFNDELFTFSQQIATSQEQISRKDYVTKELEKKSTEISQAQMKVRILMGIVGFVINRVVSGNFKNVVMIRSPVTLIGPIKAFAQKGLVKPGDHDIGISLFSFLLNRGIRQLIQKITAVRVPKGKSPMNMAKKMFGMTSEEASQTEKLGDLFGFFG
ncbi:Transmembrane_domain-containing protein [Hexamita inflata]|uniref:Transmembrane_domain-containing protein n=1 Tax=Hexamita inflata TaxID=28002 RepID=A0ABP1HST5_9EUKA